jgi:hypothetical protein
MNDRWKTRSQLSWACIILASIALILSSPRVALADACTDPFPTGLSGTVVGAECQVNSSVVAQGTYNLVFPVSYTLRLCGFPSSCVAAGIGTITVPPLAGGNTLTLLIGGNLFMDIGSAIVGDVNKADAVGATINIFVRGSVFLSGDGTNGAKITSNLTAGSCSGGRSGNITINADAGIFTQAGSVISAGDLAASAAKGGGFKAACPGGAITMNACQIDVDGKVLSQSALTGTGAVQRPGGGQITIIAACELFESLTGIISSRGLDPGADLVHLQGGCLVEILGLVESTGPGHAVPNSPKNHCDDAFRPDKPPNSTACVEVWSGGPLIINSIPPANGEINVDTAQQGGHQLAWADVFARDFILILGDSAGPYAIHGNEFVSNSIGAFITVKSQLGSVTTSGLAIQANGAWGPANGGHGGRVDVEAYQDVNFSTNTSVQAKGDVLGGGPQGGGTILAHSWMLDVTGAASANLDASGGPPLGSVQLHACNAVTYAGSSTPAFVPFTGAGECGLVPFPAYATPLPPCFCLDGDGLEGSIQVCGPPQ